MKYGLDEPISLQYWHWMVGRRTPKPVRDQGRRTARRPRIFQGGQVFGQRYSPPPARDCRVGALGRVPDDRHRHLAGRAVGRAPQQASSTRSCGCSASSAGPSPPCLWPRCADDLLRQAWAGFRRTGFRSGRYGLSNPSFQAVHPDAQHRFAAKPAALTSSWDSLKHLLLPVTTLAYLNWAYMLRVTRSSMLDTLRQDYMTTAQGQGAAGVPRCFAGTPCPMP